MAVRRAREESAAEQRGLTAAGVGSGGSRGRAAAGRAKPGKSMQRGPTVAGVGSGESRDRAERREKQESGAGHRGSTAAGAGSGATSAHPRQTAAEHLRVPREGPKADRPTAQRSGPAVPRRLSR